MTLPYKFRIMAALPSHAPIELFRSPVKYSHKAWSFWTRDLAPEWTCWLEEPLADKYTLTPRVRFGGEKPRVDRLPLSDEEMAMIPEEALT